MKNWKYAGKEKEISVAYDPQEGYRKAAKVQIEMELVEYFQQHPDKCLAGAIAVATHTEMGLIWQWCF